MLLKGISFRTRLLIIFLPILIVFMTVLFVKNHFAETAIINDLIHSKLKQLTSGLNITFKTLITSSIRNYLRGNSEAVKNQLESGYIHYKNGLHGENKILTDIQALLSKNEVSFFIINGQNPSEKPVFIKKPDFIFTGNQELELYKRARQDISDYVELTVKNSTNNRLTKQAIYFTYIRKWKWFLFISFNKKNVKKLINLEYMNNDILSLKVGKDGYAGIIDTSGNLLIHPWNVNENVIDQTDINGKYIYREMIKKKNGILEYNWVYGDGIKKSVIHYSFIPDINLIIFVSTPLSDHYAPFYRNRATSLTLYLVLIIAAVILIILVSSSIVKPLDNVIHTFNEITDNLDFKEVNVSGDKEIIALGKAFNIMIKEVENYSVKLEETVQQRTLELKSANSMLKEEIEERKTAQKELLISEERYQLLANVTFEGIIIHDEAKIIDCNQSFADMMGYQINDIVHQSIYQFISPDDIETVKDRMNSPNEEIYEIKGKRKDNSLFEIEICSRNILKENKTIFVAALRDITERKRNENELKRYREHLEDLVDNRTKEVRITNEKLQIEVEERKNIEKVLRFREELLRMFVEYVPAAVAMLDRQLCFAAYSKKWLIDYHLGNVNILGKNIYEIFPEMTESWKKMHQRGLRGETHKNDEEIFVRQNGIVDWIKWEMLPWRNELNEIGGIVIFTEVITEKKQLQEERELFFKKLETNNLELEKAYEREQASREEMEAAFEETQSANEELQTSQVELQRTNILLEEALVKAEEANKLKSEFLAIMSHELRTPLTGMLGFSELLVTDAEMNAHQKKFAQLIYNSGRRLLDVLNDILEISVIEAGKIKIEPSDFNVVKVIDDIEVLLADKLASKGLKLGKELNGLIYIYADPSRIRQILFNLIGNAIKFTNQGEILVTLKYENENYIFSVKDTGIGIDEKDTEKIFNIFTQVEDTMRRRYGGTGLGLNICKKLVEALRGKIWVKSKINVGSEFFFSIPAKEITTDSKVDESDLTDKDKIQIHHKRLRILFAEDDPASSILFYNCIEEHAGWDGKGFENGRDLLDEFQKNREYDIILLDIQMPVMDGLECLAEIRKLDNRIPIIAVTAFAMKTDELQFREKGFTDYLSKPVKLNEFYTVIERNIIE